MIESNNFIKDNIVKEDCKYILKKIIFFLKTLMDIFFIKKDSSIFFYFEDYISYNDFSISFNITLKKI